jgi:uncharacterized membrane protein YeaQ/YmgE (transglycosylase-associated protein family)
MEYGPIQLVQFVRFLDGLGDGWLAIVVYGVFAGFLAAFITSRERRIGLLPAAVLGIAGALLAIGAAHLLGIGLQGPGRRFLAAFAGSMALALLFGLLTRRRRTPP